jgi:hypothetical protein
LKVTAKHNAYQHSIQPPVDRDIEMLFDIAQNSSIIYNLSEEEIDLQEGQFHEGKAMVIRFTGKKK